MSCQAFMGVDLGGTGAKAGLFDIHGRLLGFGQKTYAPEVSPDGHAEIPIETIYAAARESARTALAAAPGVETVALSISSQGQTYVALDEADRPLHRAVMWYDSRAADQAARLAVLFEQLPSAVRPSINTLASVSKAVWWRERDPGLMARARRILLLPEYLVYRLTGEAVTDYNTAESTGVLLTSTGDFSTEALKLAGFRRDQFARVVPSGQKIGVVRESVAREWGLPSRCVLVSGTNDQYAGALGAGNCRPGILSETTGTCLAGVTLVERLPQPLPDGLFGGCFPIPGMSFVMAYSKTAGLVLNWFRDNFGCGLSLKELDSEAAGIPPGARGVSMIPHFDGAVSPNPDPAVRGIFAGLTLRHGRAELYRSILEALAFSLRENIEHMQAQGIALTTVRSIGGGAKSALWLQIKADVTGLSIEQPEVTESAVLGAAMLAAVGWGSFVRLAEASERLYRKRAVFTPDPARRAAYDEAYARYRALCGKKVHGVGK
jgi:xylulokinase